MIIKVDEALELRITVNADNSCKVTYVEHGVLLGSENWKYLHELLEEYGI